MNASDTFWNWNLRKEQIRNEELVARVWEELSWKLSEMHHINPSSFDNFLKKKIRNQLKFELRNFLLFWIIAIVFWWKCILTCCSRKVVKNNFFFAFFLPSFFSVSNIPSMLEETICCRWCSKTFNRLFVDYLDFWRNVEVRLIICTNILGFLSRNSLFFILLKLIVRIFSEEIFNTG